MGALDFDLASNRPGKMVLLSSSAQGLDERDVAIFEDRADAKTEVAYYGQTKSDDKSYEKIL